MIHRYVKRDKNKYTSTERILSLLLSPVITEKSNIISSDKQQYSFKVALNANKIEIKRAIERVFSVNVISVNTTTTKGKCKKFKGIDGKKSDYKKAIVKLADGQKIDFESTNFAL